MAKDSLEEDGEITRLHIKIYYKVIVTIIVYYLCSNKHTDDEWKNRDTIMRKMILSTLEKGWSFQ